MLVIIYVFLTILVHCGLKTIDIIYFMAMLTASKKTLSLSLIIIFSYFGLKQSLVKLILGFLSCNLQFYIFTFKKFVFVTCCYNKNVKNIYYKLSWYFLYIIFTRLKLFMQFLFNDNKNLLLVLEKQITFKTVKKVNAQHKILLPMELLSFAAFKTFCHYKCIFVYVGFEHQ